MRDGAVSETAADAFQTYVASRSRHTDEEEFHLFKGFNDVFVALASVLLFSGIIWFSADLGVIAACLLVMAVAVALSEYFTLRKRLALSSILYVLAFSIAAAAGLFRVFWPDSWLGAGDEGICVMVAHLRQVRDIVGAIVWRRRGGVVLVAIQGADRRLGRRVLRRCDVVLHVGVVFAVR